MNKKRKKLTISEIVGYALLHGTTFLFLFSLLSSKWKMSSGTLLLRIVLQLVIFCIPTVFFIIMMKKENHTFRPLKSKLNLPEKLLLGISGAGVITLVQFLYRAVFPGVNGENSLLYVENMWDLLLLFFLIAVIPAVLEEIFYRGIVLRSLSVYHSMLAIVMSALFFGLMHFSVEAFPLIFFSGLTVGAVYYATSSLGIAMAVHLLTNGVWFFAGALETFYPWRYPMFMRITVITAAVVMLLGLPMLKKTAESILADEQDDSATPATEFWNLPIVLFLILSVALQLLITNL